METCSEIVVLARKRGEEGWKVLARNTEQEYEEDNEDKNGLFDNKIDQAEKYVKDNAYTDAKNVKGELGESEALIEQGDTLELRVVRMYRKSTQKQIEKTVTVEVDDE